MVEVLMIELVVAWPIAVAGFLLYQITTKL